MEKQIFVTDFDMKRFKWLLNNSAKYDSKYNKHLKELEMELLNAVVVDPKDIPPDIVTMHSKFSIRDLIANEESVYTLVFPFDADIEQKKLSILDPIGIAVIGYRKGDVIECEVSGEKRKIMIEKIIYQPEAEGNYYI